MKTIKTFLMILFLSLITLSCEDKGVSDQRLTGKEDNLPVELKGLKVYSVSLGGGDYVRVAVLNNALNGSTYTEGKSTSTTIVINKGQWGERTIMAKEIVMENDSFIMIKKK